MTEQFATQDENVTAATATTPAKAKKSRRGRWLVIGGIAAMAVFGAVTVANGGGASTDPHLPLPTLPTAQVSASASATVAADHEVVYKLNGTAGSVDITYQNETGGTEQRRQVNGNQDITMRMDDGGFASLVVQSNNNGPTTYETVSILVDGQVVKTATASGAYAVATVSTFVGL